MTFNWLIDFNLNLARTTCKHCLRVEPSMENIFRPITKQSYHCSRQAVQVDHVRQELYWKRVKNSYDQNKCFAEMLSWGQRIHWFMEPCAFAVVPLAKFQYKLTSSSTMCPLPENNLCAPSWTKFKTCHIQIPLTPAPNFRPLRWHSFKRN